MYFTGHDHTRSGAPVLVRQHLPVHADREERQGARPRRGGGPRRTASRATRSRRNPAARGELARIDQGGEHRTYFAGRSARRAGGCAASGTRSTGSPWTTLPRSADRTRAPPADGGWMSSSTSKVFGLCTEARPRGSSPVAVEALPEPRGVILVDAELVKVVVGRRRLEFGRRFLRGQFPRYARPGAAPWGTTAVPSLERKRQPPPSRRRSTRAAPVERLVGDVTRGESRGASDQHDLAVSWLTSRISRRPRREP